jgi:hypothetical protein
MTKRSYADLAFRPNAWESILRSAAFPSEPTGVAHIRWAEQTPKPLGIPTGTVGIVGVARVSIRREGGIGWLESKNELHLWLVSGTEEPREIVGERLGEVIRTILAASVRTKIDLDQQLAARMSVLELDLLERYRRRTEADVEANLRYAGFPLCAIN